MLALASALISSAWLYATGHELADVITAVLATGYSGVLLFHAADIIDGHTAHPCGMCANLFDGYSCEHPKAA
jgi:hypothetical protein